MPLEIARKATNDQRWFSTFWGQLVRKTHTCFLFLSIKRYSNEIQLIVTVGTITFWSSSSFSSSSSSSRHFFWHQIFCCCCCCSSFLLNPTFLEYPWFCLTFRNTQEFFFFLPDAWCVCVCVCGRAVCRRNVLIYHYHATVWLSHSEILILITSTLLPQLTFPLLPPPFLSHCPLP